MARSSTKPICAARGRSSWIGVDLRNVAALGAERWLRFVHDQNQPRPYDKLVWAACAAARVAAFALGGLAVYFAAAVTLLLVRAFWRDR